LGPSGSERRGDSVISGLDASGALKWHWENEESAAAARVFWEEHVGERLVETIGWIVGAKGLKEMGNAYPIGNSIPFCVIS